MCVTPDVSRKTWKKTTEETNAVRNAERYSETKNLIRVVESGSMGNRTDLWVADGEKVRIVSVEEFPAGALAIEVEEGDSVQKVRLTRREKVRLKRFLNDEG